MKIGSDTIGSLLLGTEEFGKAYLGAELVHGKEMPYDAKIECLETTGTQYIDTGIIETTRNFEVTLVATWTGADASQSETFFGYMSYPTGGNIPRFQIFKNNGKFGFHPTNKSYTSNIAVDNARHTFFVSGNETANTESIYIDGALITTETTTADGIAGNTLHHYLGGRSEEEGLLARPISAKFYYLNYKKFADAAHTQLVQEWNFIPVRVGQVGYMYDTISGQLFGNDGTGAFTLGADVANEMSLRMSKSFIADNPTILYNGYERWTYRGGLLLRGVLGVYDAYSNDKDVSDLLAYAKKYYHDCVNSGGIVGGAWGSYAKSNYDSDQVQAGYNLFRLKQLDSDTTYQGYYENVIGILIDQLADQPRLAEPTSVSGTAGHPYQHKANYAYQHWLDGDFMVEPFRALYAHDRLSGQSQADMYDDIVEQLINAAEITRDTNTQLYRHAYAGQGSSASWSENGANTPGRSYFAWGRALGWYILAINEVLDIIPSTHNPTRRSVLIGILSNLLSRLLTYRDTSGVWALLPTLAVDSTNNKLEATSSCMYAYGYLHGVRMCYLSADMRDTALSVYQAVVRNFVTVNGASVTLSNCILGGNPGASNTTETDVLNNYYGKGWADNDEHGVGPFIMAALEHELLTTSAQS